VTEVPEAGPAVGLPAPAWEQIRRGRRPEPASLAAVAEVHVATEGLGGAAALRGSLHDRLLGAGPLEPLLSRPGVTDVAVNGDGSVWVDVGGGLVRTDVDVGGPGAVRRLAVRLAGVAGRRLDETSPFVDGVLPSGVRLHAILPPLVADGPHLTLRVPARETMSLVDLEARAMFPAGWGGLLRALVRRRVAFVVSGGTGVGKTTLLGAMLGTAPPGERIVVVEDVRELRIDRPQVVRLEARPPNVEGAGEVTLTTLVRQALRMRPDRIVLGEARGAEVRELLAALNTGHEGGCGTVHANSAADVVTRFQALGALAGMSPAAVHAQLVSAVAVVVHLARSSVDGETRRRVETVGVLVRDQAGRPSVVAALSSGRPDRGPGGAGGDTRGPGWPRLLEVLRTDELEEPVWLQTGGSGHAGLSWSSAARSEGTSA
jgi:pilus assembly protein CpaF